MARRLVEAGVEIVTTTFDGPLCGRVANWDDHAVNHHVFDALRFRAGCFDQAVSALIEDVYQRGLDKRVLVVVTGEFGRTPRISYVASSGGGVASAAAGTVQPGRDHWPHANSMIWAGGGIRTGQVIGATDRRGEDVVDAASARRTSWPRSITTWASTTATSRSPIEPAAPRPSSPTAKRSPSWPAQRDPSVAGIWEAAERTTARKLPSTPASAILPGLFHSAINFWQRACECPISPIVAGFCNHRLDRCRRVCRQSRWPHRASRLTSEFASRASAWAARGAATRQMPSGRRRGGHLRCRRRTRWTKAGSTSFPSAAGTTTFASCWTRWPARIDAVTVSTPDHHARPGHGYGPAAGQACYTQKPLTRTIWEARRLGEIAREANVPTQMGNQGTSFPPAAQNRAAFAGRRGRHAQKSSRLDQSARPGPKAARAGAEAPVPPTVHWELWLGPARSALCTRLSPARLARLVGFWLGALGDMACHTVNMPYWPWICATRRRRRRDVGSQSRQLSQVVDHQVRFSGQRIAAGVSLTWYDGGKLPPGELFGDGRFPRRSARGRRQR